ncbi:MAG: GyrI-like domain-containing protein [Bacteroidia bacterium]
MEQEISVKDLARLSGFSLFHFHRIFKAIAGESPYESLLRLRLEKAVFLLKYEQKLKIAEIGYEIGFSSPENFSRQFKSRYNITPGAFRKNKALHDSRIYQESHAQDFYLSIDNSRKLPKQQFEVKIERLPEIPIASVKAIFGIDGSGLIEQYQALMTWAEHNSINIKGEKTRFGMSIDNPEVTPASKFRYDFALKLNQPYPNHPQISFGSIPEGDYATVHVQGNLEHVAQAWDFLYREWLPSTSYVPIHYPAIEEFIQGPEEIGWDTFNIKCRIPVTDH